MKHLTSSRRHAHLAVAGAAATCAVALTVAAAAIMVLDWDLKDDRPSTRTGVHR